MGRGCNSAEAVANRTTARLRVCSVLENYCEQPSAGTVAGQVPLEQQAFPQHFPLGGQHLDFAQQPPPEIVAQPENAQTIIAAARGRILFIMTKV